MSSTFICSYCNQSHPIEWKTNEHIIPKALKNENYVLPNACRKLNNYMSHSFEKKVLQFGIIKLILLLIDPPTNPTYFTEVQTDLDRKVHGYILPSRQLELTEHPTYLEKNTIELLINGNDGETHPFNLILPFYYKGGITGIPRMVVERNRVIEQEKNKINKYLKELSENPEINKPFNEFLQKIKGEYIFEPLNIKENELPANPPIEFPKPIVQSIAVDNESLFKLFLKIAWTHANKQFGAEKLSNSITNEILQYLTTGHILDYDLIKEVPELFTKPIKIENEDYVFWKYGLDETIEKIDQVSNRIDTDNLRGYHIERFQQFDSIQQLVIFNYVKRFDPEFMKTIHEYRFHNISLRTEEFAGQYTTVCHMQLFGGIFDVMVKLSESPLMDNYPQDVRIEF